MAIDKNKKILIVDDNQTTRQLLRRILEHIGFTDIFEADDGQTGLEKLSKVPVDLIFTDWHMHHMTGIELLKKIRSHETYKDIPVIMITVNSAKQSVREALEAGASSYITKPFDTKIILKKMIKVFKQSA